MDSFSPHPPSLHQQAPSVLQISLQIPSFAHGGPTSRLDDSSAPQPVSLIRGGPSPTHSAARQALEQPSHERVSPRTFSRDPASTRPRRGLKRADLRRRVPPHAPREHDSQSPDLHLCEVRPVGSGPASSFYSSGPRQPADPRASPAAALPASQSRASAPEAQTGQPEVREARAGIPTRSPPLRFSSSAFSTPSRASRSGPRRLPPHALRAPPPATSAVGGKVANSGACALRSPGKPV
ncbi:PREDICTED: uncharacterized protein-like [Galeopterus variegatus]|uniref:Uncharacterized protein-like n=1 Tax=Galeopterus variegatus TaxID=482537 RepID=A0ABM0Q779_GALVR|nr:PREDICTED: uncharacterized protein-like [Galeopterus variegatus]